MKKIAVYGTLKRDFYNHERFGPQTFLGESMVKGVMQVDYSYPYFFLTSTTNKDPHVLDHVIEIFEVDDLVYDSIEAMEMGAGYYPVELITEYGMSTLFVTDYLLYNTNNSYVKAYNTEVELCDLDCCNQ